MNNFNLNDRYWTCQKKNFNIFLVFNIVVNSPLPHATSIIFLLLKFLIGKLSL